MLRQAEKRITEVLPDRADVLHVGEDPPSFATTVLTGVAPEVRGRSRWVVRDVCAREPWPFADDSFAFAVCTSLALVRDPIGVCSELSRVARGGYVEVPTIEHELAVGDARWLCDVADAELVFVFKPGRVHRDARVRVPQRWHQRLGEGERVTGLFWEDRLPARENLVADDDLVDDLAERLRKRFEPSSAEVALTEARRLGGMAGAVAAKGIDALRGAGR